MSASAIAVQVFVGGEYETQSVTNMTRLVDEGYRYGIPVLGVTAVGKELVRDARYLGSRPGSAPSWARRSSRRTTAPRASRRSPRAAPCRS